MDFVQRIFSASNLSADYFVLFSAFVALWIMSMRAEKRSAISGHVYLAILSIASLYISRFISILIHMEKIQDSAFWLATALVMNTVCLFFSALFAIRVLSPGEEKHPEEDKGIPRPRIGSKNFALNVAFASSSGAVIYSALSLVEIVSYSTIALVSSVSLFAAVPIFSFCLLAVKRTWIKIRRAVIFSSLLLMMSWLAFHVVYGFTAAEPVMNLGFSRSADLLLMLSLLVGFQSSRAAERLRYKDSAEMSRDEFEKARDELDQLHRITSQVFEGNSELVMKMKIQTKLLMKKVENLDKTLEMGLAIQKKRDLKELLQMIVELVRENLGFNTVILRLLIDKTQSFESKAFVGLSDEAKDTVINYRIPKSEFEKMIDHRFRISRSYFIRNSSSWYGEDIMRLETVQVDDAWREIEMLIVPLMDEDEKTIGYLSVEDPRCVEAPVADVIENLESIATLAVSAIKNASVFKELEEKNEKLKLYAEKLESLNKMKSDFVATISHEFKTPLTSIKAYCETLINNSDKIDRKIIKEFLEVIDEESDRLMALIEDILNFSQMQSGAIKFERSECNLNEIINLTAMELEKNFASKNITLDIFLPSQDVFVRAEKDLMKQLVMNIMHNASKFTQEKGHVSLRLEDETVSARLIVEDNGKGVPEDQMDKIFDHFHQVDSSITRQYGGSGLGLALCKNIVDWHDGRIWVENIAGGGARFIVVIPKKQVVVRNRMSSLGGPVRRFEVERYLELLIEMVAELLFVKRASLMLFDMSQTELKIESAIGIDEEIVESARVKVGDSISGKVVQEGETYLVEDIENDPRTGRCNNEYLYESKSFLSVPIRINGKVIGVVNVANPVKKDKFDEEDKDLLEMFVERMSHALRKLEEYTNVSEDFERIRIALKSILDTKRYIDVYNELDLSKLVLKTAEKLDLDNEEKVILQYALNIYDVGLAEIGCHIIKKPKELTAADRDKIQNHTIMGAELLKTIEAMPKVKDIVLYHHENYDGSGYPGRLSGKTIPIGARIIRVADSFRALTSHRPYQKQYEIDEAIEVLKHRSKTFFDPEVVDAFITVVEDLRKETKDKIESEPAEQESTAEKSDNDSLASKEESNAQRENISS